MKKLFVLVGDGGSGKTTLIAELVKRHPDRFRKVVTCTSRPPRASEVGGVDYRFLPATFFVDNPELVLVNHPDNGNYYGTRKADLYSNTHHLLLTSKPIGVSKLVALGFSNIVVVRIEISLILKIERMRQRGDSEQMISERLGTDFATTEIDFGDVPIIELDAVQPFDEKVSLILKAC